MDLNAWVSPGRSYLSFSTDHSLPLDKKNATRKFINTGSQLCPSRYHILRAPKFNYQPFFSLWAPQLTHIIWKNKFYLRGRWPSAHPTLMKNYQLLSSSMSYETLRGPELSPLAPYYMGHCHPPLFHVIRYQVAIVCDIMVCSAAKHQRLFCPTPVQTNPNKVLNRASKFSLFAKEL